MSSGGEESGQKHDKYVVGYYTGWSRYERKFPPELIPVDNLTHICYAFGKPEVVVPKHKVFEGETEAIVEDETKVVVEGRTEAIVKDETEVVVEGVSDVARRRVARVALTDPWGDQGSEKPPKNLGGNLYTIFQLKKKHRHIKTLYSIGGANHSHPFHTIVPDPQLRKDFVQSAVKFLEDFGFDGLDVDYEFPTTKAQADHFRTLLKELRSALDDHARKKNIKYKFLLTVAVSCGRDKYTLWDIKGIDPSLDFWNLMAYDFSGAWDKVAHHQANIHKPPINASDAVNYYSAHGAQKSKLVLGIPIYGRSFLNTDGPGTKFHGVGPGTWEKGIYDYRVLPLHGSTIAHDQEKIASWSYDGQKREFMSFDDEKNVALKGHWIREQGLGGGMFWELSADKGRKGGDPVPGESLVKIVKEAIGPLDRTENWLEYKESRFENIRNHA